MAQRVAGARVLAVETASEMAAVRPGPSGGHDADVAASAQNVMAWTAARPRDTVKIRRESGRIGLGREVDRGRQPKAAARQAVDLMRISE